MPPVFAIPPCTQSSGTPFPPPILYPGPVFAETLWMELVILFFQLLIGHAIGWTIGKNFRRQYDALNSSRAPAARGSGLLQFNF